MTNNQVPPDVIRDAWDKMQQSESDNRSATYLVNDILKEVEELKKDGPRDMIAVKLAIKHMLPNLTEEQQWIVLAFTQLCNYCSEDLYPCPCTWDDNRDGD